MPSEYTLVAVDQPGEQTQPPAKLCSICHTQVNDAQQSLFLSVVGSDTVLCSACHQSARPQQRPLAVAVENTRVSCTEVPEAPPPRPSSRWRRSTVTSADDDKDTRPCPPQDPAPAPLASPPPSSRALSHATSSSALSTPVHYAPSRKPSIAHLHSSSPSPLTDISRLRMRSQAHHCLYPGSTFQGTQTSGKNSYDVNVTIVDVDFLSSSLCGYLRIRGLTDDWPELTTYFDAEIIGSRYGFLTRDWGATEDEDMTHWSFFPAFRHVKNELKPPYLTMSDRDRGAVFMRWKERFLVPDHRVQDINGASFAGFYYICVDFNPHTTTTLPPIDMRPEDEPSSSPSSGPRQLPKSDLGMPPPPSPAARKRRDSSTSTRRGARSVSQMSRREPPVATMSGFYFHQNSERYQELSLQHVPERTSSTFEFR